MSLSHSKTILKYNDQIKELPFGKRSSFEELYLEYQIEKEANYTRYRVMLHPKENVVIKGLSLIFDYPFSPTDQLFCNGYQSWSESREFQIDERIPRLRSIARPYMKFYGDEHIDGVPRGKGWLHSWTYSYIRQNEKYQLIGSLNEQSAFTIIAYHTKQNQIHVIQDCEELTLQHSFPILDILVCEGSEKAVFDQYFALQNLPLPSPELKTGWTSWYHYYTDISEEIITKNLEAFAEKNVPADIIQIDDGFQERVGDWLKIKNSFPNGMGKMARKIQAKGFKAGIWLAPFVCEEQSDIFKNKKSWLLKDEKGQAVKAGYTPLWSGWFYALDFYNLQVQEYLTGLFYTIFNKWGFDMVKLDFLYAACILPRPHKTRGQVMHDALSFIRGLAGDKLLLGCGVPLGSAFGLVDYCRIGADIHLEWEHRLLHFLRNRERVSTAIALESVIGRRHLNGRAFGNDPDVFMLRKEKNKLTEDQQFTILLLNCLFGNLLFTSDYLGDYNEEQWSEFGLMYEWKDRQVQKVIKRNNKTWIIEFSNNEKAFIAFCNLSSKGQKISYKGKAPELEPYESMILSR